MAIIVRFPFERRAIADQALAKARCAPQNLIILRNAAAKRQRLNVLKDSASDVLWEYMQHRPVGEAMEAIQRAWRVIEGGGSVERALHIATGGQWPTPHEPEPEPAA